MNYDKDKSTAMQWIYSVLSHIPAIQKNISFFSKKIHNYPAFKNTVSYPVNVKRIKLISPKGEIYLKE